MEAREYETMYSVEDGYWWYLGLRDLLLARLRLHAGRPEHRILDAGCGTGGLLDRCRAVSAFGVELATEGIRFCRARHLANLAQGSVCDLPFRDATFDCVVSADVLCNLSGEEVARSVREFWRVLKDGGTLILNLPAYERLRSTHDVAVHIRHRFTRRDLRERLERQSFRIDRISYRNTALLPVAAGVRISKRFLATGRGSTGSDLKPLPAVLNSILAGVLYAENRLIRAGVRLPFGLSLYCEASKHV